MRLVAVGFAIAAAAGIAVVQPALAATAKKVHARDDTSSLPPPEQLRAMTFGYHSAVADLLWASLLVEHGVHTQEHRPFHGVTRYLDGILELEPQHPMVYNFVDTLLLFRPGETATEEDARVARVYLERGTKARPYDHEVWLHYGQYLAFLAPSFLKDKKEIDQWRKDGAFAIAHAIELGADAGSGLSAATILNGAGEQKAEIMKLQRMYAVTDNEDTRYQIILKLSKLEASLHVETAVRKVEHEWHSHYGFLTRGEALLVGPLRSPAACAGREKRADRACPADWSAVTRE